MTISIPLWAAIIVPLCCVSFGFIICAMMTMSKVADEREYRDNWELTAVCLTDDLEDAKAAHARATDRGNTLQARIDRALEQVTDNANATVKRIERILRGEQP